MQKENLEVRLEAEALVKRIMASKHERERSILKILWLQQDIDAEDVVISSLLANLAIIDPDMAIELGFDAEDAYNIYQENKDEQATTD